jgi:hypothetical protein
LPEEFLDAGSDLLALAAQNFDFLTKLLRFGDGGACGFAGRFQLSYRGVALGTERGDKLGGAPDAVFQARQRIFFRQWQKRGSGGFHISS